MYKCEISKRRRIEPVDEHVETQLSTLERMIDRLNEAFDQVTDMGKLMVNGMNTTSRMNQFSPANRAQHLPWLVNTPLNLFLLVYLRTATWSGYCVRIRYRRSW